MMKKTLAIIMALVCSLSLVSIGFAADAETSETPAQPVEEPYDYTKDPLVNLKLPIGVVDYANGNLCNALEYVTNEDGTIVREDMYDEFGDPVYADATQTTLKQTEKTQTVLDENGNPAIYLGAPTTALFQITSGKAFSYNNVPKEKVENEQFDKDGNLIVDAEGNPIYSVKKYKLSDPKKDGSVQYEGITISAYYAVNCPSCHMTNGGYSYYALYNANRGKCKHCGYTLPSPADESMKFYRFIVVNEESKYYSKYKEYDFTKAAKDVFGSTAQYYGDGVDLPQQFLVYEGVYDETVSDGNGNVGSYVETLTGFKTSGKTKNGTMATIHMLLTKIEYKFEPVNSFLGVSFFIQLRANFANAFLSLVDKILSFPFT